MKREDALHIRESHMTDTNPHNLFPYRAIVDAPKIRWPNNARVAVWVIPNVEQYRIEKIGRAHV